MAKKFEIRNSTAEFLTFVATGKEEGIQVLYKDETIWATQKAMATLFDCSTDNIGLHLKNIFKSGELMEDSVTEKISATAADGKNYLTKFYNLDAIISVGYRVNSIRATQFRQWCTYVLRQFAIRGYVIDKKRMENGREGAHGAYLLGERPRWQDRENGCQHRQELPEGCRAGRYGSAREQCAGYGRAYG